MSFKDQSAGNENFGVGTPQEKFILNLSSPNRFLEATVKDR